MSGDLEQAQEFQAAIRAIVERRSSSRSDWPAAANVRALCREAAEAAGDEYCRTRLHLVAEYASELLGNVDHSKWDCGTLPGAEFLRRRIAEGLALYCDRVARVQREACPPHSRELARAECVAL